MSRKTDEKLVALAIEAALAAGASEAEGFFVRSSSTTAEVSGGKVETVNVREAAGIGIRVINGERLGFSHTSDLAESQIERAAKEAVANAESAFPDPYNRLPEPTGAYADIEYFDGDLAALGVESRIEKALLMESAARSFDKRITKVRQSTVADNSFETYLVSNKGISVWRRGTSCSASVLVVAESDGDAQMGWEMDHTFYFDKLSVEPVGRKAAQRAVALLGASQVETAKVPIILDSPVACEFLAAVGHALMADQVQKRKSFFAGKVGQKVASEMVTIVDDGMLENGYAPSPADGEGVASRRTELIRAGALQGFLHNTYTAAKDAVSSTGNGVRSSYSALPEVGPTNFYLVPGVAGRDEIIRSCSRGYLVMDVMGMHTVDMVSGDFSVGASGLWIEHGKITAPVRETTIAGNVKDFLVHIEAIGNDLKFYGRFGSPTILVANIVVSGK